MQFLFQKDGIAWKLLRDDPDRYIYEPVRQGVNIPLPENIEAGINDVSKRDDWNKPAAPDYALPTETWREHIARRNRCLELRQKLADGEINSINDLITYNLNIRQLAQDVIENCYDPELVWAFYQAITKITILDPTCGSGAFLFSALNILEPLYEACLEQMQIFLNEGFVPQNENCVQILEKFRQILEQAHSHRNLHYFIIKSIVINNLYGVDIMQEATEICKLRLFLKLTSQLEPDITKHNNGIEPLPDIDFNIRAGNTLVGFTSLDEVRDAITKESHGQMKLVYDSSVVNRIEEKAQAVDRSFQDFRDLQIGAHIDSSAISSKKIELRTGINQLREELDCYLADEYEMGLSKKTAAFESWKESHQPFHWFIEFYNIVKHGSFDVIIGNPPYLEQREVGYILCQFVCQEVNAIHAACIERSLKLLSSQGCMSMIVPLSIVSTQRMQIVQELLESQYSVWYSNYSWRPGKLFETVNRALTIFVIAPSEQKRTFTTSYQKWNSNNRYLLMSKVEYVEIQRQRQACWIPKLGEKIESLLLKKYLNIKTIVGCFIEKSNNRVYYRTTGGLYWKVFTDFSPAFKVNGRASHSSRETWFTLTNKEIVKPIIAILSSDLFWWWYTITTNCRDINPYDIQNFPIPESALYDQKLIILSDEYLKSLQNNSLMLVRNQQRTGRTETQSFKIQKSKPIINEIDRVLAQHYGFTDEELDFIINYDIKYRMGKDSEDESNSE